jgi:ribosomal protein S27E
MVKEWIDRYKHMMQMTHGWEVPVRCPACGHEGIPAYDGWKPSLEMRFGNRPTVFAAVKCRRCGCDLKPAAGAKLRDMFGPVALDSRCKRLLMFFVAYMLGAPLIAVGLILMVFGARGLIALPMALLLVVPAIPVFNYRIAYLKKQCACGDPHYVFMGLLGRSYCYRCSHCGRLLRTRD